MKVSVIIVCHEAGRALERTVNSVLEQSFADLEIVVVDDASAAPAATRIEELAGRIGHAALVRLDASAGAAAARNAGLARAQGEYVAFLDAGDEWEPGVLAKVTADLDLFPWADGVEFALRLADADPEPHPQQLALVANALSGNLVLRREFVRGLGGFPIDEGLQGRGDDVGALRLALRRWGTIGTTTLVHLIHSAKGCPIVAQVVTGTRMEGDRLEVGPGDAPARAAEEAAREYLRRLDAAMLQSIGSPALHRIPCEVAGRRFEFEVPNRPEFIGQATAGLVQSEYPMLPFLGSVQTILEVGAGSGASTVNFACNHANARVIALEPSRAGYVLLRRNVMVHPRVECYRLGLFNTTTRLELVVGDGAQRETALFVEPGLFLQSLRVERVDILRLDNTGLEVVALLALGERLREIKAAIVRYRRDTDRRIIDDILSPTHMLYWGRSTRPNQGEFLYVQRALLGPDGRP